MEQPPEYLLKALPSNQWLCGEEAKRYRDDPRDRFEGFALPVALPRTTAEVSSLVKACQEKKTGIIPYSGGTGVVAGQLSLDNQNVILLSLEKMNTVRSVSTQDGVIIAEAGCILADIHDVADDAGMSFPLSMASQGSSRIGGNLATNCGGIQVLRYGNARDLCLGIEAVMADGSVLEELTPLRKNNTGYDLRHLLIGSEGTLGIITAASLIMKPKDDERLTALCAVPDPASAVSLLHFLRSEMGECLSAFELMCDFGFEVLAKHFPEERFPMAERSPWYVLMEVGGRSDLTARFESAMERAFDKGHLTDAVIATSENQRNALWRLRENMPEANRLNGAICNSDTAVPLSEIDGFITSTYAAIHDINSGLTINCYGHTGDGNMHFNVFPPTGRSKKDIIENDPQLIHALRNAINETTVKHHGSISAEHGIGRLKRDDLLAYGSATKHALMRSIKQALDPNGILNPGALIAP